MAKQTKGKKKTSKPALKRTSARARQPLAAATRRAFPGGAKKTEEEIEQVVPPARA
jgi:hypothetical protein